MRISTQLRRQRPRRVVVIVEILDVLTQDRFEAQLAQARAEGRGSGGEVVVLESCGDAGDYGNDEEPQGVTVAVEAALFSGQFAETVDTIGEDGAIRWMGEAADCKNRCSVKQLSDKVSQHLLDAKNAPSM